MTTKTIKIFRETAVPTTWQADSIYYIASATNANLIECYITNSSSVPRRVINEADITTMISAGLASAGQLKVVANIAARNALAPTTNISAYVRDATADTTVKIGGAYYLYDSANSAWVKTAEAESMDVVMTWDSLTGKPASTPTQIDDSVTKAHTHTNKTQLDKIGEDASGNVTYNGSLPRSGWETTNW